MKVVFFSRVVLIALSSSYALSAATTSTAASPVRLPEKAVSEQSKSGVLESIKRTPRVLVDPALDDRDYHCVVTVSTLPYDTIKEGYAQSLPGVAEATLKSLGEECWWYTVRFFGADKRLVKELQFPGDLLIPADRLNDNQPLLCGFNIRQAPVVWGRRLLALEGDALVMYELSAQKEDDGSCSTSVDFGKRILIQPSGVVRTYVPRFDAKGSIYFKVSDSAGAAERAMVWDYTTEAIKPLLKDEKVEAFKPVAEPKLSRALTGDVIISKDITLKVESISDDVVIIDPLAVDTERLTKPFKGYGTKQKPITKDDFNAVLSYKKAHSKDAPRDEKVDNQTMHIGKVIVLWEDVSEDDEYIFAQDVLPTVEQRNLFEEVLEELYEAFELKQKLLRELKLLFRQFGPRGKLNKWISDAEFKSLINALTSPGADGSVKPVLNKSKSTSINPDTQDVEISWSYYLTLKQNARKGFDERHWETYSSERNAELSKAVRGYAEKMMGMKGGEEAVRVMLSNFLAAPDKKDYAVFFESFNNDLDTELLFDYLAVRTDEQLDALLSKLSKLQAARAKSIIQVYKKTNRSPVA